MEFSQAYLTNLVEGKPQGDFESYTSGSWYDCEPSLPKIIGRISDIKTLNIWTEIDHYGSGYASYMHLFLSKKDKSDQTTAVYGETTKITSKGLMIYLCRLAPYAVYGAGTWGENYRNGKKVGGHWFPITIGAVEVMPEQDWSYEINAIADILNAYGFRFLTRAELEPPLDFEIKIPSVYIEGVNRVFDCFFHWED